MIKVKLVQFSISKLTRQIIATSECEYPRFIHAEIMTHRVFSRNAGSSRAIPTMSAVELAAENKCYPEEFRYNQSGMQPAELMDPDDVALARAIWDETAARCLEGATRLQELKLHKQWSNRMLEWFSPIKVVITATEWSNFLWLRDHSDAQKEIQTVAQQMKLLMGVNTPFELLDGEWHVPYVSRVRDEHGEIRYFTEGKEICSTQALLVSQSCCAQLSYRRNDTSVEKAKDLHQKFTQADRLHASPFEHQASPMIEKELTFDLNSALWPRGVTHVDRNKSRWSGNFKGFIQYRQLMEGQNYIGEGN